MASDKPRASGVGQLVQRACADGWKTLAQIREALSDQLAAAKVDKAVHNLWARGNIERSLRDNWPTRYRAVMAKPVRGRTGPASQAERESQPAEVKPLPTLRVVADRAIAYSAPAEPQTSLAPVLGVVCMPQNAAQGRIEDAIAAALDAGRIGLGIDEVLGLVPNGWSRTDVVAAMADGVVDGWIRSLGGRDRNLYVRCGKPARRSADPLVQRFKHMKLLERCQTLDSDLADALADARECDAAPELVSALVELRRSARRTAQQLGN